MQAIGFGDVAVVLTLGAMPWLNYLKPLRWHLTAANFNPVPIFNAIATICAAILTYLYSVAPDPTELFLPPPIWLLPIFIVPAALYLWLFLSYRQPVANGARKWPLLIAFLVYIGLFCSLAVVAGNLQIRREFKVVRGMVVDPDDQPVSGANVDFAADAQLVQRTETEDNGSFRIALDRKVELDELLVNKRGFEPYQEPIAGEPKTRYRIPLVRE